MTGTDSVTPTGTVTFYVCGPFTTATACTSAGTKLGSVGLSGSGNSATATGPSYTPAATGIYCFLGVYSGDGNYAGGSDGSTTRECFTVTVATPGVTTAPTSGTIILGGSDSDGATVTGTDSVTPTGTVTFYVCGPFTTATACTTAGTKLGSVGLSGSGNTATATGPSYTPAATGIYCFLGVYSGDGNYAGASDNSTSRECFTVTMATPTVTTAPTSGTIILGGSDSDGATVTGVLGITPTGSIHFYVCPGNANPCTAGTAGVVDLGTVTLSGSGNTATATGPSYTPAATGIYCFLGVYSGDGNYAGASDNSTSRECFTVTMATPTVTTAPTSGTIILGGSDSDGVTVTGVSEITPTGTVTFYVCGPFTTATACTTAGTKLGSVGLSGSGNTATATGPSYTPAATGIYCFLGVYSGDGNYAGASDNSTSRECFTVTMATPTVTTAPTSGTIILGGSDSDGATVTGTDSVTPTGTVTFYVCGPFTTATACTSAGTKLGSVGLSGSGNSATATGPSYTPAATGIYCFLGVYSGDGNYAGGSDGSTTRECFTVTMATPGVTTSPTSGTITLGGSDSDGATVTGTDGVTPTGSVTFYLCTGNGSACTAGTPGVVDLGTVTVSGSGDTATATSPSYTPAAPGAYCFLGVYSGDGNYAGASDSSTIRECFIVKMATPTVTTSPTSATIKLGNSDSDSVTVAGTDGVTPTGSVHFYVCPGNANACTTGTPGVVDLGMVAVSGSGDTATTTGPAFKPSVTGAYCFLGVYSGDNNYAGASDSSTTRECFTVTVATPTVTTSPTSGTVTLGGSDSDGATVTGPGTVGVTPTGTVTFYVCGPFKTATACTTTGTKLGAVTVSGSGDTVTATSPSYTPKSTGIYCFLGVYSGDNNYAGASDSSTTRECFTVTMDPSSVVTTPTTPSIVLGHTDSDSVVVTGSAAGGSPTGTVTFYVCGPTTSFTSCTSTKNRVKKAVKLTPGADDTSTATSKPFEPTAVGDWCFAGYYSGDSHYLPASDSSVEECIKVLPQCGISVTVSPNPLIETGDSEIHGVVQVEACTKFANEKVEIDSTQLTNTCQSLSFGTLQSGVPPGNPIQVTLDNDGNATVTVTGIDCAPGQSLIEADLVAAPYLTTTTILSALPPAVTTASVVGYPADEVETGDSPASGVSDVYAVFYVETDPVYAGTTVDIDSAQLFDSCLGGVTWTSNQGTSTVATATAILDDDGNAVFVFTGAQCAPGSSAVIADAVAGTHTTYTTTYTVLPPTVT